MALITGKIDGAILAPPFNVEAETRGLKRPIAGADIMESGVTGLNTHVEKLQKRPDEVKRMVRALLKAQSFIKTNGQETVKITADWLKQDSSVASGGYEIYLRAMSLDGLISDQALRADIEAARLAVNVPDQVPSTKAVDFTILKEVLSELKSSSTSR